MIASLIITHDGNIDDTLKRVVALPGVEIGTVTEGANRFPITLDSPAPNALEEITRNIQECPGVAFVDVVFVHFEDDSKPHVAAFEGTNS
ncbi:chaperone NapD [bacterium]|jgi:nitrate reductase NapAB chaperone NapD|nr:hypothetical protein [Planctomicrobium sp.]MDA7503435.1 chaperone NapD [bacterium]MDB4802298.1 chaperone NapD [bacterium]